MWPILRAILRSIPPTDRRYPNMTSRPPTIATAPSPLPQLSARQSSALIRSAAPLSRDLIAASFPHLLEIVLEGLASRWDFDVGSPLVQRLLLTRGDALAEAFMAQLAKHQDAALARLLAPRGSTHSGREPAPELDAALLELVVESEDGGEALAMQAARRMRGPIEEQLRELDLVVGFLAGRDQFPTTDNPYGPHAYVPALLEAAIGLELHAEAWAFFLNAFETDFAAEIGRVSRSLLDHFRMHGVEARAIRRARNARRAVPPPAIPQAANALVRSAGYAPGPLTAAGPAGPAPVAAGATGPAMARPIPVAPPGEPVVHGAGTATAQPPRAPIAAAAAATSAAVSPAPSTAAPAAAVLQGRADAQVILNELLSRLQTNAAGGVLPPLTSAPGAVAPSLLDALGELQALGMQGIHGAMFAGTSAGSINAWREHLIAQSPRTVDKLTIEIVGMLFDHVLRDPQVPSEIKALLSRLQFPVLKAALLDAAFFASSAHPARRLIDRIAAAAIGWEPYGDENKRFRAEVDRLVCEVMEKFERDIAVFERVLTQFEGFLGDIAPRDSDPIARARRALEEAEKREVLTINTTIQVRTAFETVELEAYLRDFLIGPWVQVLVQASLRDDQTKGFSRSFREAIHELVWSVQPKATTEERRRLVELIPVLTRTVRDGLALIRLPEHEQDDFFRNLMASHAFAVKPVDRARYIRSALQSSEVRARMEGLQLTGSFPLTAIPGGVKVPPRAVMRAAADHEVELSVPEALTDVGEPDKAEDARLDQDLALWVRGSWFDLWDGKAYLKARLRWISPLRTMFMFSSGPDNRAHVMSPELIRSYLRRDYIRPLESAPLTERAAHAVVADFANTPDRAQALASRLVIA